MAQAGRLEAERAELRGLLAAADARLGPMPRLAEIVGLATGPARDRLAQGRERLLDLAAVEGRRFVSMVGAGFDAEIAARLASERTGPIRMRRYATLIVGCLARYGAPRIGVGVDGAPPVEAQGFALVSNVSSYGGPFRITPHAKPDDGSLDVCLLPRGGFGRYLRAILACMGRCPGLSGTRHLRGRSVRLTCEEPVHYHVDGDPAGLLPATVELMDRKIRFIVP